MEEGRAVWPASDPAFPERTPSRLRAAGPFKGGRARPLGIVLYPLVELSRKHPSILTQARQGVYSDSRSNHRSHASATRLRQDRHDTAGRIDQAHDGGCSCPTSQSAVNL